MYGQRYHKQMANTASPVFSSPHLSCALSASSSYLSSPDLLSVLSRPPLLPEVRSLQESCFSLIFSHTQSAFLSVTEEALVFLQKSCSSASFHLKRETSESFYILFVSFLFSFLLHETKKVHACWESQCMCPLPCTLSLAISCNSWVCYLLQIQCALNRFSILHSL